MNKIDFDKEIEMTKDNLKPKIAPFFSSCMNLFFDEINFFHVNNKHRKFYGINDFNQYYGTL